GLYVLKLGTVSSANENSTIISDNFALSQNYPNPFNPITTITYYLPKQSFVKVKVNDELGREVRVLVNETKDPGSYSAEFNSENLSSGIYFYTIEADNFSQTKKMILMK
ncbi:MAG TPA: T9SS type A sorting domain-containing protein, partial [Ignavibacteria bacterium]|nr:T9SS type A sorting domain-containing protein [Ignavibacteria bacterium]